MLLCSALSFNRIGLESPMPVSAEEFKEVASRVASTVTVVTANGRDGLVGLTMTAFMAISADPAIVLVSVEKGTTSLQPMLDAEGFTVNVMPQGAEVETMHFSARGVDRFGLSTWSDADNPVAGPVLESAMAHLECSTIDRTEVGDHWVIYGEVLETQMSRDDLIPLVWCGRSFVTLGPR